MLRIGFSLSEYSIVGLNYTYKIESILPYNGAPLDVQLAVGQQLWLDRGLHLFL